MRNAGKASVKADIPKDGMRKVWVTFAAIGTLLIGLVLLLAFKNLTDGMWTAWCVAVAGMGGAYAAANVVTKAVTKE